MRGLAGGIVVAVVAVGCANHTGSGQPSAPKPLSVPCTDIIASTRSAGAGGYRIALGGVSVPPALLPAAVASSDPSWPYWRKTGLVVRAGRDPVTVTVPSAWRRRAAITWGNGLGVVSTLEITACSSPAGYWNAYAGGIYTTSPAACVPLVFRVGARSRTVRFGIGRRCGGAAHRVGGLDGPQGLGG
jgi:hypothetical protein